MQPEAFHSRRTIVTKRTRLDHIVLAHVLVLKMSTHCNLSLETSVTYWAMVWQSFRMRREVFCKMVLPKESLLAYSTLIRFYTCMPHLKDCTICNRFLRCNIFLLDSPYAVSCWLHLKISCYIHHIRTFFYETGFLNGLPLHLRRFPPLLYLQCSLQPRHLPGIDLDEQRKLSCL